MDDRREGRAEGGRRFQREGPIKEKNPDMAMVVLVRGTKSSRLWMSGQAHALGTSMRSHGWLKSTTYPLLGLEDIAKRLNIVWIALQLPQSAQSLRDHLTYVYLLQRNNEQKISNNSRNNDNKYNNQDNHNKQQSTTATTYNNG